MIGQETLLVTLGSSGRAACPSRRPRQARRGPPADLSRSAVLESAGDHDRAPSAYRPRTAQRAGAANSRDAARCAALLTVDGRFPTRRTWERRLARPCPPRLPAQIGCSGPRAGRPDPALGDVWPGGGDRQHGAARPRRRLAQEGPRGRRRAAHLDRYRGALDQVGLARLGLRLEAALWSRPSRRSGSRWRPS